MSTFSQYGTTPISVIEWPILISEHFRKSQAKNLLQDFLNAYKLVSVNQGVSEIFMYL